MGFNQSHFPYENSRREKQLLVISHRYQVPLKAPGVAIDNKPPKSFSLDPMQNTPQMKLVLGGSHLLNTRRVTINIIFLPFILMKLVFEFCKIKCKVPLLPVVSQVLPMANYVQYVP